MAKVATGNSIITHTEAPAGLALPDHLKNRKQVGVETLKEYVILPSIKTIQKSAGSELLAVRKVGDLVVLPTRQLLRPCILNSNGASTQFGKPFVFISLFFFPSWCILNDIKEKGFGPTFLKYTTDRNDPLVALCRNATTREQPHPTKKDRTIKNCEMLNHVILIEDAGELSGQPIILTFMKGSYRNGSDFNSRIRMSQADIFARRWVCRSRFYPNPKGDYYAPEVLRWEDGMLDEEMAAKYGSRSPWISEEELKRYETAHAQLAKQYETVGLKGVEDEDAAAEPVVESAAGNAYA